jgi:hypothetical protein
MKNTNGLCLVMTALVTSLLLASCGSGTARYSVGGTMINLAGAGNGVQLQDNGGDTLTVNANGTFTFPRKLTSGSAYSVRIFKQPSAPAQTCGVTKGTGTATANVTDVLVDCGHNEWTWMSGANLANPVGIYGTLGTPAPGNVPGGRWGAGSWTDPSGSFWLFGGAGVDGNFSQGHLNDLWKYSAGEWTWMSGANVTEQGGTYGTLGIPDPGNVPGSRYCAANWTDASGNLWLFGGVNFNTGDFNDLWKYSAGEWTWMSGANVGNQPGTYGTMGTPAPGNVPGARDCPLSWTDPSGNFWLFGGAGYDSSGTQGQLNDLWKYSSGEWTWMGGANVVNQVGTYGTQGTPAPGNIPGARSAAVGWTDPSGNFWLFGGIGWDSATGPWRLLNDLWKYSAGEWTWMSGPNVGDQPGTYGTKGIPAPGNVPGGRYLPAIWTDPSGHLWLFGGYGNDLNSLQAGLNDLWKYSAGQWTWMSGANVRGQSGTYGTLAIPDPGNVPGSRYGAVSWTDPSGNLLLFGGSGLDGGNSCCFLNDWWKYEP